MAVWDHREAARRTAVGVLEPELDLLLDVPSLAGASAAAASAARAIAAHRRGLPPKNVWKKSENGSPSPNISRISSGDIVRKPPG